MKWFKTKLDYILKHNQFINKIFRFTVSTAIRFIGLFVKIDDKAVLFTAHNKKYNDSPKVIYERILSSGEYSEYKFYWAVEESEKSKILGEAIIVKPDTLKYFITALKCKYWVACVNIERSLKFKRKKQVYINTWHGIPIKTVGNEAVGRKDYDFSHVDSFCASSDYEADVYIRAFNVKEENILKVGMPRNDELYNVSDLEIEALKEKLNLPKDKKIILYAPTWRDSKDSGASYQIKPPIDLAKWEKTLGDEYVLLFRTHPYTNKLLGVEFNDFVRDYISYPSVNDLLKVSDLLISDYSGTLFDYAILEKPMFCFAYDFEEYVKERGFSLNYKKEFSGLIAYNEDEILANILNCNYILESERTKEIKRKYLTYGGNATDACVKALFKKASK